LSAAPLVAARQTVKANVRQSVVQHMACGSFEVVGKYGGEYSIALSQRVE
jgi:hypothetical protein